MTREAIDLGLGATRMGGSARIPHSLECDIAAVGCVEQLQPRSVQVALLCRADLGSMSVVGTCQEEILENRRIRRSSLPFARGCTDARADVKRLCHAAHIGKCIVIWKVLSREGL